MRLKNLWQKCVFVFIVLNITLTTFSQANDDSEKITKAVNDAWGKLMGDDPTVIGDLTISNSASGGKEFSGPVSMFGKGNLQLTGTLSPELKPAVFKVEFPPTAIINLSNLDAITGGRLKEYIPASFPQESGIAVNSFEVQFDQSGYNPIKLSTTISNSRPFGLMGDGVLMVDKTDLEFIVDNPKDPQRKITGILKSVLKLGGINTNLQATLSTNKNDIQFKGTINNLTLNNLLSGVGAASIANTMPASISSLGLNSLSFTISPFQKTLSILGNSSLGEVELRMSPAKSSGGRMQFLIGIAPPASFKFSNISSALGLLDGINLSGTALVISDYAGEMESSLASLKSRQGKLPPLVTGLNIFTHINLGNELGSFLGKPDLDLYGSLDKQLNCNLAAALNFDNLKLADNVFFKEVKFGVGFRPSGGKVNLNLSGRIDATIKGDLLSFNAGFDFSPTDVQLSSFFLMEALKKANQQIVQAKTNANNEIEPPEWNEPFGVKGFGLRKLGFSVGVSPKSPIFLSSLGITADARLGINPDFKKNISGSFTANLDIANPFNSMLDVNLQNITIIGLVDAFKPNANISGTLRSWLDWGLEKAYLRIIPESKTYLPDNKHYDRGILAGGTLKLGGLSAIAELKISETSFGFKAMVDPIDYSSGGFTWFALKGFEQGNKAQANLQLNTSNPEMVIDGSITVLGITSQTSIKVNSQGAKFKVQGSAAGGTLSASLEVEAQQLSATGGFRVKAEFNNQLQDEVVKQLIAFIKRESAKSQTAYSNAQSSLQKAKNASNNAAEKGLIDAANGFVSAFKEIDKGMAVAGQYVVKGLIGDAINIRKIYFETNLNMNQLTVAANVDMTIAGKKIVQTANIDLNIRSVTAMAEKIVSQIQDVVVSAFEDLGSDIEKGWNDFVDGADKFFNQAGKGFEQLGKEFAKAGAAAVNWVQGAAETVYKWGDETFNGKQVEAPNAGSSPSMIPYNVTKYIVTITGIRVIKIPTTDLGLTTMKPDGNELEIFGSITMIPNGSMWANKNSNKYGFNLRQGDNLSIALNTTRSVNISKYFYCNDDRRSSTSLTLYTHLFDSDDQNIFTAAFVANEEMRNTSTINLGTVAPGQTSDGSITAYNRERDHGVTVYYKVQAVAKISDQQMISAVNSKNASTVESTIRQGGNPFINGLMQTAIRNNDAGTMQVLGKYGVIVSSADMTTAIQYAPNTIETLIKLGGIPGKRELSAAIDTKNANMIISILRSGVQPDHALVRKAIESGSRTILSQLLQRGIVLTPVELQAAINKKDAEMVAMVLRNGAVPTEAMLIESIRNRQEAITNALISRITPGHNALQEAANINNVAVYKMLVEYGGVIINNNPVSKAIDHNNAELVGWTLKSGGNSTDALRYAIQKNNKPIMQLCLDNRADPSAAIGYAVRTNDMNLVNALLSKYNVSPNECMQEAIANGNVNAATAALNTRRVRSNSFMSAAAIKNNMAILRALTESGGDPNLAMPVAVRNKNAEMSGYLLSRGASASPAEYIIIAIQNRSNDILRLLIANGANVNYGMPVAISMKDAAIVKYLLENGARPSGHLSKPAGEGNLEIVKLLLDKGANPNEGMSSAVTANQTAVVKMLLMAGASAQGYIHIPAAKNNIEMVNDLLKANANPDPGMSPAVNANYTSIVKLLLDNGASVKGHLNKPSSVGNLEMVRMLLDRNANPNDGIQSSITGNHTAVIKLLIERGANGNRFIAIPSGFGNLEIVKLLLAKGANAESGIKAAVDNGHAAVTETLITGGADATKREYMTTSVTKRYASLIPVLVKGGNKVDSTIVDAKGRTYLHNAAEMDNNFELVKELLKAGSSVHARDNDGYTPLYMAVDEGKDDIETVRLLLEAGSDPCAEDNKGRNVFKEAKGSKVKKLIKEFGGSRKCS